MYALSKGLLSALILLYVILVTIGTVNAFLVGWYTLDDSSPDWISDVVWLFVIWSFLYVFITMFATGTFAKKMMALTDLRASSVNPPNISNDPDDIRLNKLSIF